jgi:hypothetical protein
MRTVAVTRIVEVIRTGSTRPLLVETREGRFVCKLVNGADGPRTLAAEWIGTQLAAALGLPCLELVALDVPRERAADILDTEVREMIERGAGLCLGSRELPGARMARDHELAAADDDFVTRVIALDRLIENPDRRAANPNVLRWGNSLVPIDHASSLPFHHDWAIDEQRPSMALELGSDHVFSQPRAPASGLPRVERPQLEHICRQLPEPWLGRREFATFDRQRLAYAAYLWKRQRALSS